MKSFIFYSIYLTLFVIGLNHLSAMPSGRTDRLKGAPFYKSYKKKGAAEVANVSILPVSIDKVTRTEFFYSGREKILLPLTAMMNAYLDSLGKYQRGAAQLPDKGAPWLYVGSNEGEAAPPSAEMTAEEFDKYPAMIIYSENASKDWRKALQANVQMQHVLIIQIGFTQYPKADKGFFGKKVVLGTNYEHDIRFLSAIDKPVEILQVTGMLLDRDGNILRVGAEGMYHEDAPFWVQMLELQKSMEDETLRKFYSEERRTDLPGQPLVWQKALDNLIENLLMVDRKKKT